MDANGGDGDGTRIALTRAEAERAAVDVRFLAEKFALDPNDPRVPGVQAQLRQMLAGEMVAGQSEPQQRRLELTSDELERAAHDAAFLAEKFGMSPDDPQIPGIQAQLRQMLAGNTGGGESGDDDDDDDLMHALLAWLNTRNLREQRRYLEAHPELLDPRSDDALAGLIQQYAEQRAMQDYLRDEQRLLRDIRARQRTQSETRAIRDGYVNARGGLTLDVPAWIDEAERQQAELRQGGRPDQTAPARIALLRETVARARADSSLAPQIVAELQLRLWDALDDSVDTNKRESQEEGISCLKAALDTLARYPYQYARTQNNLGATYQQRIAGERRENLEASLAAYQEALRVYTLDAFPVDYASTQNNLGNVYAQRIAGERRENLEASLAAYQEALRVRTLDAFPVDYASTQNNLGNTYQQRIAGERRENLEAAIAAFGAALRVYTPNAFPVQYAAILTNLGGAYRERIAGTRRENLDRAVECYRSALQVVTLDESPQDHAWVQFGLGNALVELDRLTLEHTSNTVVAI